jgi:hypothetical protein
MSLFKGARRKIDEREAARRPAFGIVGPQGQVISPATPAAPAKPARSIDPAAYGFVPAAQVRGDRAGASPDPDLIAGLVEAKDWPGMAAFTGSLPLTSERRYSAISQLAGAAEQDDAWLRRWMREDPTNATPVVVYAESLNRIAFGIRTTSRAQDVSREQWDAFFHVLRQAPEVCAKASELDPADAAPWITMLNTGLGLQWTNDEYRALWPEISSRSPHSFTATHRAWNYWRPRWFGSLELLDEFLDREIAAAPPGSNLTMMRIQVLHDEFRPKEGDERTAFYQSDRVNQALDAGIADAAASDPDHVKLPYLRHWLAYQLRLSGRNAEAIEQFRAIGGYAGAEPWDRWKNAPAKFCETRAQTVLAWEDAGRPAP